MIHSNLLSTIGATPLVQLHQLFPHKHYALYAKLEAFNPGGSMKDRPAVAMLEAGLANGTVGTDSVLVESSSGNLAIGLAQACAVKGLRLIVVVDPKVTAANLKILRAYGAEIDMVTTPDAGTGEFLAARRQRVKDLLATLPGAVNLNQYANPGNPAAHRTGTVSELLAALDEQLDYLFISVSTCGTLRGAREAIAARNLNTRIIAVDACGSVIFGQRGPRLLPGHGAGIIPEHMRPDLADEALLISDADCVAGCRALVRSEGILAGASSGGMVVALQNMHARIPEGSRVALILPDRGERYLDTVYDDHWCQAHFHTIPTLEILS
ncbi:2,3-diaminopropionate biosynthesis protein SbnA [Parvibium lacunae]|uniref:N-(2-amino-2-carboxyethyl)-L-glutamate synthase n=1 Tax=Parvibium lacunae TaxID=1888893 RepID=A0A368L0F1_9BURK|nr:2,3-diaminopropionate biosynthesis protein SbnA [Parvibium lacunae]RCS57016.1 2,3-diaminopropionate biosynthesis protein SbnA [Parvibium lacunae]